MTNASRTSRPSWAYAGSLAALLAALALGGCQSPMYAGTPDDMSGSVAPAYAPGTYDPPAKVGRVGEEAEGEAQPQSQSSAQPQYQYRGGRDPVTGQAKTQM